MSDSVGLAIPDDVSNEAIMKELREVKKDTQAVLDACKELTKVVGELSKNVDKAHKAGRF